MQSMKRYGVDDIMIRFWENLKYLPLAYVIHGEDNDDDSFEGGNLDLRDRNYKNRIDSFDVVSPFNQSKIYM